MTKKQDVFAHAFVQNGGKRSDAAITAGYAVATARIEAFRLLKNPVVRDAIRKESEAALQSSVAVGQFVLRDLAENAVSEAVRLQAATALLDRGGMQLVKRTEQTITVTDSRTDAELVEHARRLARTLNVTLDGTDLVRPAHSALLPVSTPTPKNQTDSLLMGSSFPAAKNSEESEIVADLFS